MEQEHLKDTFSKNLNYWLERRGKSQADLYKRMGVSSATASDWCNSKKIPRTDKLVDIANWLMVELSDLLYDKSPPDDQMNDLFYRIKDDDDFKELVFKIHTLGKQDLIKVNDYVCLLTK